MNYVLGSDRRNSPGNYSALIKTVFAIHQEKFISLMDYVYVRFSIISSCLLYSDRFSLHLLKYLYSWGFLIIGKIYFCFWGITGCLKRQKGTLVFNVRLRNH